MLTTHGRQTPRDALLRQRNLLRTTIADLEHALDAVEDLALSAEPTWGDVGIHAQLIDNIKRGELV